MQHKKVALQRASCELWGVNRADTRGLRCFTSVSERMRAELGKLL
jgi:hypothetical protein